MQLLKTIVVGVLLLSSAALSFADEEAAEREVMISYKVKSIQTLHEGQAITLMREQDRDNEIIDFYKKTTRGKIQSMYPFEPYQVTTLGEREVIDYLQQMAEGDDSIILIDSRTSVWVKRTGMIPGAINIPFTRFKGEDTDALLSLLEDEFNVMSGDIFNFKEAKTLIMYCNGIWCAQSPTAIRKLLALGYPAAKLKYYRGGMQSWSSLGLTVVGLKK